MNLDAIHGQMSIKRSSYHYWNTCRKQENIRLQKVVPFLQGDTTDKAHTGCSSGY